MSTVLGSWFMKKILGIIVLGLLLSGNAYAAKKDLYLECEEIVSDVRKGGINAILYEKDKVLGTNYLFLKKNLTIKIYFRYVSGSKSSEVFSDITKAKSLLGYAPEWKISAGIIKATPWYIKYLNSI